LVGCLGHRSDDSADILNNLERFPDFNLLGLQVGFPEPPDNERRPDCGANGQDGATSKVLSVNSPSLAEIPHRSPRPRLTRDLFGGLPLSGNTTFCRGADRDAVR